MLVDSSVIIAAFRKKELDHYKAQAILTSLSEYIILDVVLAEIATVLKIRESYEFSSTCIQYVLKSNETKIMYTTAKEYQESLDYFLANNNKLSFVDTILLKKSLKTNMDLATFDKNLQKTLHQEKLKI